MELRSGGRGGGKAWRALAVPGANAKFET